MGTLEIAEQVIADVSRGVGATVAVVNADEGSKGTRLDLALVFEYLIGLNDGHGELAGAILSDVTEPEQAVLAFSSTDNAC